MEFYQELFPLEAEFPNLCPGEGVDLGEALEDQNSKVSNSKAESDAFMIL